MMMQQQLANETQARLRSEQLLEHEQIAKAVAADSSYKSIWHTEEQFQEQLWAKHSERIRKENSRRRNNNNTYYQRSSSNTWSTVINSNNNKTWNPVESHNNNIYSNNNQSNRPTPPSSFMDIYNTPPNTRPTFHCSSRRYL
jgi:hypothetical protein